MTTRQRAVGFGYRATLYEPLKRCGIRVRKGRKDLAEVQAAWHAWRDNFWQNLPDKDWKTWPFEVQEQAKAAIDTLVTQFERNKNAMTKTTDLREFLGYTGPEFANHLKSFAKELPSASSSARVHRSDEVMQAINNIQQFAYNHRDAKNGFMAWRENFLEKL